jgi:hypothetical protein
MTERASSQQGTSLLTVPPGTPRLAGAVNRRAQPVAVLQPEIPPPADLRCLESW